MTKDDKLARAQARIDAMMQSKDAAQITLKDALLDVMVRDGEADWTSVETVLVERLSSSSGPTKLRLAAAIDRLRDLQSKGG